MMKANKKNWAKKPHIWKTWPVFFLAFLLVSCVPQGSGGKRTGLSKTGKGKSTSPTPTPTPFGNGANFFQNGQVQTTATLTLPSNFNDAFFLKGNQVQSYLLANSNIVSHLCLVFYFPSSTNKNHLIVSALARSKLVNIATGARDYYFEMQAGQSDLNKANCQKPGLLSALSTAVPGATFSYSISETCPSCQSPLSSSFTKLYSPSGSTIPNILLTSLALKIAIGHDPGAGGFCQLNEECTALGYDCCLSGQCVNDKAVRSNVDQTSAAFLAAKEDVASYPNNIYRYPNFYYLCPVQVNETPTPTPTPDDLQTAADHLENLRDLYECTTRVGNTEMSICTSKFENASTTISGTGIFSSGLDDRNFSTIYSGNVGIPSHSVYEITYAGQTLFKENETALDPVNSIGTGNDTFADSQSITITTTAPDEAPHDRLKLRYKVDGSCTTVNSSLAKCIKYYTQGQDSGLISDHLSSSQSFKLPAYADGTKAIKVYVDESLKQENTHYTRSTVSGQIQINFVATSQVFDNQDVRIEYYVNLSTSPNSNLLTAKTAAQTEINTICKCGSSNCSLSPVTETFQGTTRVVDYKCVYPNDNSTEVPLNVTVYLDSRSVPVRFYDTNGVNYDLKSIAGITQEGTAFEYTNGNRLKPNNLTSAIGFNEIYGVLTPSAKQARPPEVLEIKKGRNYDIFVTKGNFSPCPSCGSDYYTFVNKLFPGAFSLKGGGYLPDSTRTSRTNSNSSSTIQFRADDLLFGRACFVPVTMIPWSHRGDTNRNTQRRNRLASQHFLFANGYQRDWYGFDYGSVIGSYDGVNWFSVGSSRRINAKSNRLFLAVNAYFADQTVAQSFTIQVMESNSFPNSGSNITKDMDSDGAQCQRHHFCSDDADCVTQLGWDYSCQTVTNIKTTWPRFDDNAIEQPETAGSEKVVRLVDLVGGTNGQTKRCVYRGAGSPCHADYASVASADTYHQTTMSGLNACAPNSYCQSFAGGALFNDRINRFAAPPNVINSSGDVSSTYYEDEFGLGSRVLGRPFNFNGTTNVSASVQTQLGTNNIDSLCLKGRDPLFAISNNDYEGQHSRTPSSTFAGDKVTGIGMSYTSSTSASAQYLNACSVFDASGNFLQSSQPALDLQDDAIKSFSTTQTTSTNILKELEVNGIDLVTDFSTSTVTSPILQENRCLRQANSPCFTDLDCAPSSYIASKVSGLDVSAVSLSEAELKFWQEDLVCGQAESKTSVNFDLKENRCCRETKKKITIYPDENSGLTINTGALAGPGTDIALNSATRYSRMSVVYDELNKTTNPLPGLIVVPLNSASDIDADPTLHPDDQHETFHKIGTRTCCSGNWIREFSSANGGGHHWLPSKMQTLDKSNFKCVDWDDCTATGTCGTPFSCSDPTNCGIRNLTIPEADRYLAWIERLELTGISQILLQADTNGTPGFDATTEAITCIVDPTTQLSSDQHIPQTLKSVDAGDATADALDGANRAYIRADDTTDFESQLKQVFSKTEISCCLPAGETYSSDTTSDMCCTGFFYTQESRCCLEDYTDISVYLNRYVSSEAQSLDASNFSASTGYLNDPSLVEQIALQKNLCCSGEFARGVAVSELKVPGSESDPTRVRRFVYNNNDSDDFSGAASAYDQGLRWNNHVYCVPSGFNGN